MQRMPILSDSDISFFEWRIRHQCHISAMNVVLGEAESTQPLMTVHILHEMNAEVATDPSSTSDYCHG